MSKNFVSQIASHHTILHADGLGNVSVRTYKGERVATLMGSALSLSASGRTTQQAIDGLRFKRDEAMRLLNPAD